MKWIDIDVGKGTVELNDNITEGDLNSSGIRVEGFPESWKSKIVNAVFYKDTESVDVILELNADKDRFTGTIPAQMLTEDGNFKVVIYAVSADQVDEPYKDVRPAVWAEVKDGLDTAELLPLDKDVGAYLTLLIDLQNKGASIDEMIARLGDIEAIKTKLDSVEDGAEVNVQADWEETDPSSDAFIPNKPNLQEMEERLFEAIGLTNDVAVNAEASADANKEALNKHRANGDEDVKHLTDSEKHDVGKIGKIEADIGDISSIQSTKSNIVEAYNELWATVDQQGSKISTAQSGVDNIMNGEVNVPVADFANQALTDTNGNYITDFYATKEELRPHPVYVMPSTLAPNVTYNFTTQPNITLAFPTVANDGDVIYITFECAEISTNLTVDTTNTSDIDLIPEVNTGYEIYAKYNGSIWIVKYSEYTVSEVA